MLLKQEWGEKDGKTILKNTIDTSQAINLAKEVSDTQARGENMVPLGYIPPEYWSFDPWLLEAKKAQHDGDTHEYQKYILKFFRLHPEFAVLRSAKYWSGV